MGVEHEHLRALRRGVGRGGDDLDPAVVVRSAAARPRTSGDWPPLSHGRRPAGLAVQPAAAEARRPRRSPVAADHDVGHAVALEVGDHGRRVDRPWRRPCPAELAALRVEDEGRVERRHDLELPSPSRSTRPGEENQPVSPVAMCRRTAGGVPDGAPGSRAHEAAARRWRDRRRAADAGPLRGGEPGTSRASRSAPAAPVTGRGGRTPGPYSTAGPGRSQDSSWARRRSLRSGPRRSTSQSPSSVGAPQGRGLASKSSLGRRQATLSTVPGAVTRRRTTPVAPT